MKTAEGLRSEALTTALEQAAAGRTDALYKQLTMVSGLPGPRMNLPVAQAFAVDCGRLGKKVDALVLQMASLSPEDARGASGREFLPVCGVLGLAARAAKEKSLRQEALTLFHDLAEDPRFRVREAVALALARMGHAMGDDLADAVESWMDGYFQAAAVVSALGDPLWLDQCPDYYAVINRLHDAFNLAHDAPSSAIRYPGHKALVEVLGQTPIAVAMRFKLPMIDRLTVWSSQVTTPELREAIERVLRDKKMKGHFGDTLEGVKQALKDSKKPPRDPSRIVHGTRGRGGHRRR